MEFSAPREELGKMLNTLAAIVPSRPVKPVLMNVLIEGNEDGSLSFSTTDLEISIRCRFVPESMSNPGRVLVNAKQLAGLVGGDWSETVKIFTENDRLELTTGAGKFHLLGNSEEEFPTVDIAESEEYVEMDGGTIADAIAKSAFAAAKGDARYALNGVFVDLGKETAEFVASDTHRLSVVKKKVKAKTKTKESAEENPEESAEKNAGESTGDSETKRSGAIVITKGIRSLARLVQEGESVRLRITDRELIAQTSSAVLVANLVEGQFPRYTDVVPKDIKIKITANREMLLKILRQSDHVSSPDDRAIIFIAAAGELKIRVVGVESGDGMMTMPATVEGGDVETHFNSQYVIEALDVLADDTVTFQFKEADSPVRIDEGDFTHIIMPIRR